MRTAIQALVSSAAALALGGFGAALASADNHHGQWMYGCNDVQSSHTIPKALVAYGSSQFEAKENFQRKYGTSLEYRGCQTRYIG